MKPLHGELYKRHIRGVYSCRLSDIVDELKEATERQPATKDKEEKKALRKKKKQVMELEGYRDKLIEYDNHLDTLGERNSYSKTDPVPHSCA